MLWWQVRWLCLVHNSPRYTIRYYRVYASLAIVHRLPELQSITWASTPLSCLFKLKQLGNLMQLCTYLQGLKSQLLYCGWVRNIYGLESPWFGSIIVKGQMKQCLSGLAQCLWFVVAEMWMTHILMDTLMVCSFKTKNFWGYLGIVWKSQLRDYAWKLYLKQ